MPALPDGHQDAGWHWLEGVDGGLRASGYAEEKHLVCVGLPRVPSGPHCSACLLFPSRELWDQSPSLCSELLCPEPPTIPLACHHIHEHTCFHVLPHRLNTYTHTYMLSLTWSHIQHAHAHIYICVPYMLTQPHVLSHPTCTRASVHTYMLVHSHSVLYTLMHTHPTPYENTHTYLPLTPL